MAPSSLNLTRSGLDAGGRSAAVGCAQYESWLEPVAPELYGVWGAVFLRICGPGRGRLQLRIRPASSANRVSPATLGIPSFRISDSR